MSKDFYNLFEKPSFHIPLDSRQHISKWGNARQTQVFDRDFTLDEIESIIRSGEISAIRELSRYYYRTNGRYRNAVDTLASLPLYDTVVTPIYEPGKGSKTQMIKSFYSACAFIEALDVKNTLTRITREWLKSGVYFGILQYQGDKVVLQDLPIDYCRTRLKDFNNLNILEFNLQYFINYYSDEKDRDAAVANFPNIIQIEWRKFKSHTIKDPWIRIPASDGGVVFCFAEDQTPLFITAIPELAKLKDAVNREEKRDENELYKLLIQRMPIDNNGKLVFELEEVSKIHEGVSNMLRNLDTVDVLTTFGEVTLDNLQENSAATQANNRLEKYSNNVWDSLGVSGLLFNADNSSSLAYVIKRLTSIMRTYLNMYNTWIKFLINERFNRTGLSFDFEILPTNEFNLKDYVGFYIQQAQFGYPRMRAGVAMGIKQREMVSAIDFENNFLNLDEQMVPLNSSFNQGNGENSDKKNNSAKKTGDIKGSVKDITNKGGRPALADEDRSQKTQANIDSMG